MGNAISELDLVMQKRAQNAYEKMLESENLKRLGVTSIIITETRRSMAVQMAYYSRGRMEVADVKKMYAAAGLYDIGDKEAKTKITWTLHSNHLSGRAIDFCPMKNNSCWWNAPKEVWEEMGRIGEDCGLKWGGRWKDTPDCPHFEL